MLSKIVSVRLDVVFNVALLSMVGCTPSLNETSTVASAIKSIEETVRLNSIVCGTFELSQESVRGNFAESSVELFELKGGFSSYSSNGLNPNLAGFNYAVSEIDSDKLPKAVNVRLTRGGEVILNVTLDGIDKERTWGTGEVKLVYKPWKAN